MILGVITSFWLFEYEFLAVNRRVFGCKKYNLLTIFLHTLLRKCYNLVITNLLGGIGSNKMTDKTISTKEKLVKKTATKKRVVYKRNKMNEVGFIDYNKNDYQTFLYLCTLVKNVEHGVKLEPENIQREYTVHAKDIAEAFKVELVDAYKMLQRTSKKLARTALTLEHPDLFMTEEIPLCARAKYLSKQGTLIVEFNHHVMPYFKNVTGNITKYHLLNISQFDSIYSIRLFEFIQQFKLQGWVQKSISDWREVFATGKKYKMYNDFKRFTFEHAVNEINLHYPTLKLKYKELTEGKKVVAVRFNFVATEIIQSGQSYHGNKVNIYKTHRQRTEAEIEQELLERQQELDL